MDLRTDGKWPMNFVVVCAASLAILAVWGVASVLLAARTFRWE